MNGTLIRYESTSEGTFGIMTFGDLRLHTVERPWLNNKPFESCIPSGEYALTHFIRPNGDRVFALSGGTVSIYKEDGFKRYTVLTHVGNYMKDVVGCIAPGRGRTGNMVTHSRKAIESLISGLPADNILTITWGEK